MDVSKNRNMSIASKRILSLLADRQWTVYRLAAETGIGRAWLGRVLRDDGEISFSLACRIADALDVTLDAIRSKGKSVGRD